MTYPIPFDEKKAAHTIVNGIRRYFQQSGFKRGIIGISGGLDSSVTAALLVRALGKGNVMGAILPSDVTPEGDLGDAGRVAGMLGIKTFKTGISNATRELARATKTFQYKETKLSGGNIHARARMVILYDLAARAKGLVVGTGDKSEILLGYFTKWGDGSCDMLPIGGIYKTQVRKLGAYLGSPRRLSTSLPPPGCGRGIRRRRSLEFLTRQSTPYFICCMRRA